VALRFKLDENVLGEAAVSLRVAGHDVRTALEQQLGGRPDEQLLRVCRDESRILVTLNLGFGDIRACPPAGHAGVWILRPALQSVDLILRMIEHALALAASEPAVKRLWVVEPCQVRIRD
jgi:hypothetical protein